MSIGLHTVAESPVGGGGAFVLPGQIYYDLGGGIVWGGEVVGGILKAKSSARFWTKGDTTPFFDDEPAPFFWDAFRAMLLQTEIIIPTKAQLGSKMTFNVGVTGAAVRIEYRAASLTLIYPNADSEPFWNADSRYPFYDDPFYGDFPFIPWPGEIKAQPMQYQFQVYTGGGLTQGIIDECRVVIDTPDIVERFSDFTVAAAGSRLPIKKTYSAIKTVHLTLQTFGGSTAATLEVVDKNPTLGPLIRCKDLSGNSVSGVVDAIVQGY